jgi:ankyrin repeat protein
LQADNGDTALRIARRNGSKEIVNRLKAAGARQ